LKKRLLATAKRLSPTKGQLVVTRRDGNGKPIAGAKPLTVKMTDPIPQGQLQCIALTWTVLLSGTEGVEVPEGASPVGIDKSLERTEADEASENMRPSLEHCFNLYQQAEILEESEAWHCTKCQKHQQAEKQLTLWKTPEMLVLHLKRFSFRNVLWKDKLDFLIDYPMHGLNITPFVSGDQGEQVYDLYAVAHHHGLIWGGHYTAHAKSPVDGAWRKFDDATVKMSTEHLAGTSKDAYVLFYRRRSADHQPAEGIDLFEGPQLPDGINTKSGTTDVNEID
jgi:hypothetical protein